MTDWIKWNGGKCPIKSDKTRVEYKCRDGYIDLSIGKVCRWDHRSDKYSKNDIIAYRITEDHEPKMTREQITAQIEALQKQLDDMPKTMRAYWNGKSVAHVQNATDTNYFDIVTINGVPHIHGVAMKEVGM